MWQVKYCKRDRKDSFLDELDATPMRMSDDLGVELLKPLFHLEEREAEVPLVYLMNKSPA